MADQKPKTKRPRANGAKKLIAILSRKRSLYSTSRLVEAAKARGYRPLVLDTLLCNMVLEKGSPRILYRDAELPALEAVVPRIGASITGYGLAVVSHLDLMGVPVVNA